MKNIEFKARCPNLQAVRDRLGELGVPPARHMRQVDTYFNVPEGYHMGGYNVMYGDFHARWVRDPGGRIHGAGISLLRELTGGYQGINNAQLYMVWDYFSRNP